MATKGKLTDELAAKVYELLEQGLYRVTVAQLVGIHYVTFSEWMTKAREPFLTFQAGVLEAESKAERTALAKIQDSPEPADAKWYLARKFPDRWAETRRLDVSGKLDMGVKLNADILRDPRARAAIETLTDALFTNGYSSSDSPSSDSDE
jgi:hypothetical protein